MFKRKLKYCFVIYSFLSISYSFSSDSSEESLSPCSAIVKINEKITDIRKIQEYIQEKFATAKQLFENNTDKEKGFDKYIEENVPTVYAAIKNKEYTGADEIKALTQAGIEFHSSSEEENSN